MTAKKVLWFYSSIFFRDTPYFSDFQFIIYNIYNYIIYIIYYGSKNEFCRVCLKNIEL